MWRRTAVWGTAMLIAGGTVVVGSAVANSTPAGDFSFEFSSTEPDTATGLEFRQLYKNPDDPNAKPSPVRRFLFAAPEGSVFDGSAVPVCNATDQEFQQMGKTACPAESMVGTGFITVLTGIPGEQPFPADATVFNSGDGIIELFTERDTGIFLAIERPKFRGKNAFEDPDIAVTPGGPPDGMSAAREAYLHFPLTRGTDGRSFITTPSECPDNQLWTARFEWTNADGNSYANSHDMKCVRKPAGSGDGRRCSNRIDGTDDRDALPGTRGSDRISGGRGNDRLNGRRGDDCVLGRRGHDRINAGRGGDEIRAGRGRDRINCGPGRDVAFVKDRKDRVKRCEEVRAAGRSG